MASAQEVATVWRAETRRAFRSARGLSLMVLFLFAQALTLGVGGCVNVQANEQFDKSVSEQGADPAQVRQLASEKKAELLKMVTRMSDAAIESIADVPVVLLLVFFVTMLMLPLLIALMGFDQISAEIGPRSIRYLVIRAQRTSVLLGKYLSQLTVLALLLLVSVAGMVLVTRLLNHDFEAGDVLLWGLRLWLASLVIGSVYAALTSLCSALTRLPALSLFLNIILLFTFWLVSLITNLWVLPGDKGLLSQNESVLAYLRYLLPSTYESHMLSPAPLEYGSGLIAFAGFALVFIGAASLVLDRRDV